VFGPQRPGEDPHESLKIALEVLEVSGQAVAAAAALDAPGRASKDPAHRGVVVRRGDEPGLGRSPRPPRRELMSGVAWSKDQAQLDDEMEALMTVSAVRYDGSCPTAGRIAVLACSSTHSCTALPR
jgi:hypothetical protein